jgi:hypothetical protein
MEGKPLAMQLYCLSFDFWPLLSSNLSGHIYGYIEYTSPICNVMKIHKDIETYAYYINIAFYFLPSIEINGYKTT